ncbi:MAG: hypothetical protein IJT21_04975 [Synergistaceae bacterium]|nr:hypothetical protein [Synergistaceae bacterium]
MSEKLNDEQLKRLNICAPAVITVLKEFEKFLFKHKEIAAMEVVSGLLKFILAGTQTPGFFVEVES